MNDEKVINEMIDFIKEKENQLIQSKMIADNKIKSNTVKAILSKLESVMSDENK